MTAAVCRPDRVSLRVIPAAEADFAAIAAVVNAAFAVYPFMLAERTSAGGVREEAGETGAFIVAGDASRITGCALIRPAADYGSILHASEAPPDPAALYLGLVAVAPDEMRIGIGRRMVARAETEARTRGFERVILGTLREMGNVEYYGAMGYRTFATEDYEAGHWDLAIAHQYHAMEKPLAR